MNKCTQCGKETSNAKFCTKSCAASYNNKGVCRNGKPASKCLWCGKKNRRSTNKYCSNKCQQDYKYYIWINKWRVGLIKPKGRTSQIRRFLFWKYNSKCSKCGWGIVNIYSKSIPLEVEHIDGNHTHNQEDNLDLLCPNCHSLTPTYRALNLGNGRAKRRKRYKEGKSY